MSGSHKNTSGPWCGFSIAPSTDHAVKSVPTIAPTKYETAVLGWGHMRTERPKGRRSMRAINHGTCHSTATITQVKKRSKSMRPSSAAIFIHPFCVYWFIRFYGRVVY